MNWEKIPCRHCGMKFENLQDRDEHERCHVASTAEVKTELGRWYGDEFCPHPGQPCIDGCYYCGRPVAVGAHDHTMVEKHDDPLKERYSCVCPNC